MKIWFERILAGLRWAGEKLVAFVKFALAKLKVVFDTLYDPPPRTIRFFFWSVMAGVVVVWCFFAFTNSWFYKPTVAYFTTMFEDGDVVLPEHVEPKPLPEVVTRLPSLPSVEVVCHDMSDTPQCEEVKPEVTEVIPVPIVKAKPEPTIRKYRKVRRKPKPYQTYWGF
jgi:hypothetical protein